MNAAQVRDYSTRTPRERWEDLLFSGAAIAVIVLCLAALAASWYASTALDMTWLTVSRRLLLIGGAGVALVAIVAVEYLLTRKLWFSSGFAFIVVLGAVSAAAHAGELPSYSMRYRIALQAAATAKFGLDAPVARIAAQIQQESGWHADAESSFAQGLAQFTPPTAKWLPTICPDVGAPDPWDPNWSIRAIVCYDFYLQSAAPAADMCNRWAFTLSDYNGGQGNRAREQRLAAEHGADRNLWWENVERYNARSASAWRENRDYVRRILLRIEPEYIAAGWPGTSACP